MIIVSTNQQQGDDTGGQVGPYKAHELGKPLTCTWTSYTGQQWTITDRRSPVYALQGATGFGMVEPAHWWDEAPSIDGADWQGSRTSRGEVFVPLDVRGVDSDDFLAQNRAFMQSLDPSQVGALRFVQPDGEWREALCRYTSGADQNIDLDPVATLHARYGITWATGDPYWHGTPITTTFTYVAPLPLFPGPPFVINPSLSLASSSVTNPGDVSAYAVWRVSAPFTGFRVGVGAGVVAMTLAKSTGWVEINADPAGGLTMLDESGADVWGSSTEEDLLGMAIPPGERVILTTSVTGAAPGSQVMVSFSPRYRRAW